MTEIVTIENDRWQIGFVPSSGGSIAFGKVRIDGAWHDLLRPTPPESLTRASETASYPLVPWSNRIRDGRFRWAGRTYQLRVNFADGTAIHGTAMEYPWKVVDQTPTSIALEFVSRDVYGVNFPWTFDARFEYALVGDDFVWTYSVTNTDHETFPAGYGHHPYFLRSVAGSAPVELQINVNQAYDLVDCMPTAGPGAVRPEADFSERRTLGTAFVDDCLTGRTSPTLATITYPDAVAVDIVADASLPNVVLYIPEGKEFFALEPVSNANEAFNLEDQGIHGTGMFLVQPGETVASSFTMTATPHTP